MGSFARRGGQRATRTRAAAEGALRPAPLAASSNETHLRPPCRAPRPAALQRPTAETGAPAPPATLPPPAHASPTTQELTPSVQFLPFQARTATKSRVGRSFHRFIHNNIVRYRKYYRDASSSQASHNADVLSSKNIIFSYIQQKAVLCASCMQKICFCTP